MLYKDMQYENTYLPNYSEPMALQELLKATNIALDDWNERMNNDVENCDDQFTINIGGKSIAFYLGGPQADALFAFVDYIAGENLYEVNIQKSEVKF